MSTCCLLLPDWCDQPSLIPLLDSFAREVPIHHPSLFVESVQCRAHFDSMIRLLFNTFRGKFVSLSYWPRAVSAVINSLSFLFNLHRFGEGCLNITFQNDHTFLAKNQEPTVYPDLIVVFAISKDKRWEQQAVPQVAGKG